ncbi:hypothetical protein FBUS_03644, partial [Fasciolopsis buskii]
ITYLFILNAERLCDAPNSGVSFVLTLLTTFVALVRCWNLGVDHLQRRGFQPTKGVRCGGERSTTTGQPEYKYSDVKIGINRSQSFCPTKSKQSGLLRVLLVTFWRPLILSGFLKLIYDILLFLNPILLK